MEKALPLDLHATKGTRKDGMCLAVEDSESSLCSGWRTETQGMATEHQPVVPRSQKNAMSFKTKPHYFESIVVTDVLGQRARTIACFKNF
jgi:hypothetical protein